MRHLFQANQIPAFRGRGVELRIVKEDGPSGMGACVSMLTTSHPLKEGDEIPPAMQLRSEEAQQLCDALWEAGIRPSNSHGSAGQLDAIKRHLEDMRTLVFAAMKEETK